MDKRRKYQIISIAIIAIMYFFVNIQRVAIPGAIFDVLQGEFNARANQITALGSILMYIYALLQLVLGVLVDKYSGKNVIKVGSIFFCLGSLAFVFAHTYPILFISRVLVAIGVSTYYMSLICELRQSVPERNYGLVLSIILSIGYVGGIFAGAPFVVMSEALGWREALFIFAILSIFFSIAYYLIADKGQDTHQKNRKHFKISAFKDVIKKADNIKAITYACAIYGSYYLLQTVIGKKFLQDFCHFSSVRAASVMSATALFYAFSGIFLAFLSKEIYHRKVFFLRVVCCINFVILSLICIFLIFNIRTQFIAPLFCTLALGSSISSLLVPFLQEINENNNSTAISLMIFSMYSSVGILGSISGLLLNIFPSHISNGIVVYSTKSYLILFILLTLLVLLAMISVFNLKESKKIQKLLGIYTSHQ